MWTGVCFGTGVDVYKLVLYTYVASHVTKELQEIGTALALTPPELDDIEENH